MLAPNRATDDTAPTAPPPFVVAVVVAALAFVASPARVAHAGEPELPVEQQALILARALAYDRDLAVGAGGTIDVAVLASSSNDRNVHAFRVLERKLLAGLPVQVHVIPADVITAKAAGSSAVAALTSRLAGMDALFVPAGLDEHVEDILVATRAQRVTTLAGSRRGVERGLSLGVFLRADRPTILVNLPAAKAEGASFQSELFKIAEPLR